MLPRTKRTKMRTSGIRLDIKTKYINHDVAKFRLIYIRQTILLLFRNQCLFFFPFQVRFELKQRHQKTLPAICSFLYKIRVYKVGDENLQNSERRLNRTLLEIRRKYLLSPHRCWAFVLRPISPVSLYLLLLLMIMRIRQCQLQYYVLSETKYKNIINRAP